MGWVLGSGRASADLGCLQKSNPVTPGQNFQSIQKDNQTFIFFLDWKLQLGGGALFRATSSSSVSNARLFFDLIVLCAIFTTYLLLTAVDVVRVEVVARRRRVVFFFFASFAEAAAAAAASAFLSWLSL